jgi:hypothetical protein
MMVFVSGRKRTGPRPGHNMRKQGFNAGVKRGHASPVEEGRLAGQTTKRVAKVAGGRRCLAQYCAMLLTTN